MIVTRTPFRITLGGGGTDLPSYYTKSGGLVMTMAINKHIYITLKPDDFDRMCKLRYSGIETVRSPLLLKHSRAREALDLHKINAVEINTSADLPANSGLGSSGSFLVGLLTTIRAYKRIDTSPGVVAEEACHIEIDRLKEPVGKQDQYIAAYGGVQILEIDPSGAVKVTPFKKPISKLLDNLCVYSLNMFRSASDILSEQNKASLKTRCILDDVKQMAIKTIAMLESGDYDSYGELLHEYWTLKRGLSSKITNDKIDSIYNYVRSNFGVLGGKVIGAGGGGFLMLYANNKQDELDRYMTMCNMPRLSYAIDREGSKVLGNFI